MNRSFSILCSYIMHPLFVQWGGILLIVYTFPDYLLIDKPLQEYILWALLLIQVLIPLSFIGLLRLTGRIRQLTLEDRTERFLPYFIMSMGYFTTWLLLHNIHIPGILTGYLFASGCVVAACGLGNLFLKISAHAAGMGGLTGLLIFICLYGGMDLRLTIVPILILSGLVISARMRLEAHNKVELYSGFFTGVITGVAGLWSSYQWL